MPVTGKTLLTYTLFPTAVTAGTQAALTLNVTASSTQTVKEISVRLPVGAGADDLTSDPNSISTEVTRDATGTVHFTKDDDEETRYVAVATGGRDGIRVDEGQELRLTLKNIRVNKRTGIPNVTIVETARGGNPGEHKIPVSKFAAGFTLKDFRPSEYLIDLERDINVDLRWYIEKAGLTPLCKLSWGTDDTLHEENVSAKQAHKVSVWHDTAFNLTATLPGPGGRPLAHSLNTFVTVAEPRLTATELTVGHATRLFGRRHTEVRGFGLGASRSASFSHGSSLTLVRETTFQATSDGLLTAQVRNLTPGTATTLHIHLLGPDGGMLHILKLTGTDQEGRDRAVMPVPHGHRVTLMATGERHDARKTLINYRLHAEWSPIGTGSLDIPT
ncbi:hypothetical protein [Streptomyces roseoverticillatus]|uniref:hypothetical protein n=1 Tax=Streptomyces roseoverticillatus TaxID=66429 RepID=UPI0004BF5603|nr:hypothetical protein [Streptomyces roseoverticillatus]